MNGHVFEHAEGLRVVLQVTPQNLPLNGPGGVGDDYTTYVGAAYVGKEPYIVTEVTWGRDRGRGGQVMTYVYAHKAQ